MRCDLTPTLFFTSPTDLASFLPSAPTGKKADFRFVALPLWLLFLASLELTLPSVRFPLCSASSTVTSRSSRPPFVSYLTISQSPADLLFLSLRSPGRTRRPTRRRSPLPYLFPSLTSSFPSLVGRRLFCVVLPDQDSSLLSRLGVRSEDSERSRRIASRRAEEGSCSFHERDERVRKVSNGGTSGRIGGLLCSGRETGS